MSINILELKFSKIFEDWSPIRDFFGTQGLELPSGGLTPVKYFESLDEAYLEEIGIDKAFLQEMFVEFYNTISSMSQNSDTIESLTIIGGQNKSGIKEDLELCIKKGEIVCIVGPTGSGKSRLLADIEWMANGDTPSKRRILIDDKEPDRNLRYSGEKKLVAQLSQNMNFVMDMTVEEFVTLHAESRYIKDSAEKVQRILEKANELAGEKFASDTPLTSLSGGQSRALMIADTAILSSSPIVLIDEIENAGIDRRKALQLLVDNERIVLMATHDPVLALYGEKRIVIENGGIKKIIQTSQEERKNIPALLEVDKFMTDLRNRIRAGETMENIEFIGGIQNA